MKSLIIIISVMFASFSLNAQTESDAKSGKVYIQTSAQCGDCKTRIEDKLNYTPGVKFAELDLKTKKVLVKFNPKKITLAEIKKVISDTGYAAGETKANNESLNALPKCCQPGGH